jgi:1-aminocyclopropane-1-carboxylate deaminase
MQQLKSIQVQSLTSFFIHKNIEINVLRLDEVHPIVSGNKWFKLQYYLQDAIKKKYKTIATFGGAFSNHIVATAFACKELGLNSIGIVRGEKPTYLSSTLQNCIRYNMDLHFVERSFYKTKLLPPHINLNEVYIIPEGGYGLLGMQGATTILQNINTKKYTHIICACGTGTTLAGIINVALPHQKIIGINVLKGYPKMIDDIKSILPTIAVNKEFEINNEYHFNGYAKYNTILIDFMNELFSKENLPTDIVYTAKLFYAINDMLMNNKFEENSKLLVIHTGGLQGNVSLPQNTLIF